MRQILFVDRDGTICKEPHDEQVDQIEKIELLDGVIPALLKLQSQGFELVMVSNQDGLGTDSFPQEDFDKPHNFLMKLLSSQGIHFSDVLICPHFPSDNCECRKPRVGLVKEYLKDPSWDRTKSAVIGDRASDIELAHNMGIRGLAVGETSAEKLTWADIVEQLQFGDRTAAVNRKTKETEISITVNLDSQTSQFIDTGIPFFDHMLEQISKHGGISLGVSCHGDTEIDDHHSVEDVGLALGACLKKALGNKSGIGRYGFVLPMDDVQAQVALDLSGRFYFKWDADFSRPMLGALSTEMISHFFRSVAESLGANLHMSVTKGNEHHMCEALFKGFARSLKQAVAQDGSVGLPSTKGLL